MNGILSPTTADDIYEKRRLCDHILAGLAALEANEEEMLKPRTYKEWYDLLKIDTVVLRIFRKVIHGMRYADTPLGRFQQVTVQRINVEDTPQDEKYAKYRITRT